MWRCASLQYHRARSTQPVDVSLSRFATVYPSESTGVDANPVVASNTDVLQPAFVARD